MQLPDVTPSERERLRAIAESVAAKAAELVMRGFRKKINVATKSHAELLTDFDVASEELVREELQRLTPEIAIVGEEHGGVPGAELTWFIDPIDGTINYIAGHPYFAVSIGLMLGEQPLVGAVAAPALGLSWSAAVEGGAWRNGEPCRVSPTSELSEAIIATALPSRKKTPTRPDRSGQFLRLLNEVRDIRTGGSSAVDLCFVADGTVEAYWMRSLPHWDTSAGAAIVLAAGGSWDTSKEHEGEDLATNGALRTPLTQLLQAT